MTQICYCYYVQVVPIDHFVSTPGGSAVFQCIVQSHVHRLQWLINGSAVENITDRNVRTEFPTEDPPAEDQDPPAEDPPAEDQDPPAEDPATEAPPPAKRRKRVFYSEEEEVSNQRRLRHRH